VGGRIILRATSSDTSESRRSVELNSEVTIAKRWSSESAMNLQIRCRGDKPTVAGRSDDQLTLFACLDGMIWLGVEMVRAEMAAGATCRRVAGQFDGL